jgi:triphosphoribosyl-dephospho-CoA synthase
VEFEHSGDKAAASWLMMGRLMQTVEDTTALHRCGRTGLDRLHRDGRRLEETIAAGEDPFSLLRQFNEDYRRKNLTMGGVADMLGLAFGYLVWRGFLNEITTGLEWVRTPSAANLSAK